MLLLAGCKRDVEACFTFSVNINVVSFASTCSIEAATFEWEFGDGETSSWENPVHTYANKGNYTVILRVTDRKGRVSTFTESVTCASPAPHNAKFSGTYSLTETCDSTGAGSYIVIVSPHISSESWAKFEGIYNDNSPIVAVIHSDGTSFTFPGSNITTGGIEGIGPSASNADGSIINVVYRFRNSTTGFTERCTAVLTRQ